MPNPIQNNYGLNPTSNLIDQNGSFELGLANPLMGPAYVSALLGQNVQYADVRDYKLDEQAREIQNLKQQLQQAQQRSVYQQTPTERNTDRQQLNQNQHPQNRNVQFQSYQEESEGQNDFQHIQNTISIQSNNMVNNQNQNQMQTQGILRPSSNISTRQQYANEMPRIYDQQQLGNRVDYNYQQQIPHQFNHDNQVLLQQNYGNINQSSRSNLNPQFIQNRHSHQNSMDFNYQQFNQRQAQQRGNLLQGNSLQPDINRILQQSGNLNQRHNLNQSLQDPTEESKFGQNLTPKMGHKSESIENHVAQQEEEKFESDGRLNHQVNSITSNEQMLQQPMMFDQTVDQTVDQIVDQNVEQNDIVIVQPNQLEIPLQNSLQIRSNTVPQNIDQLGNAAHLTNQSQQQIQQAQDKIFYETDQTDDQHKQDKNIMNAQFQSDN